MDKDELRDFAREIVRSTKTEEYFPKMLNLNSEEVKVITPLIQEENNLFIQELRNDYNCAKMSYGIAESAEYDPLLSNLFLIGEA